MARIERPVSPHAGIYSWQITNTLSILHRLTGILLTAGLLVLVCWLTALASGPEVYAGVHAFYAGTWFKIPLALWAFCLFYHLSNGIRHLCWDLGFGFGHAQIRASGWGVVFVALAATGAYVLGVIL
ncbi:MAG TPA: succinate dehydrogenase, cytochrome b556 subunit [Gammaproteobacteria bacterium]